MKFYNLFISTGCDSRRTFLGTFSEDFCRAFCKEYGGRPFFHIYAEKVN